MVIQLFSTWKYTHINTHIHTHTHTHRHTRTALPLRAIGQMIGTCGETQSRSCSSSSFLFGISFSPGYRTGRFSSKPASGDDEDIMVAGD